MSKIVVIKIGSSLVTDNNDSIDKVFANLDQVLKNLSFKIE